MSLGLSKAAPLQQGQVCQSRRGQAETSLFGKQAEGYRQKLSERKVSLAFHEVESLEFHEVESKDLGIKT